MSISEIVYGIDKVADISSSVPQMTADEGRLGWEYVAVNPTDIMNLTLFSEDGVTNTNNLFHLNFRCSTGNNTYTDFPYLEIKTKPKGDGSDANPAYHSREIYEIPDTGFTYPNELVYVYYNNLLPYLSEFKKIKLILSSTEGTVDPNNPILSIQLITNASSTSNFYIQSSELVSKNSPYPFNRVIEFRQKDLIQSEITGDLEDIKTAVENIEAQKLDKDGFSQVLLSSAGGTAVKADTTCVVQNDPENRDGWNLTNSVAGTKFNLYYFNGAQETMTLGDINSVYFKGFINVNTETNSMPFIHIYTKPTGVGDQQPWYHSKIDYLYNNDNTIGIGEECIFYGEGLPTTKFNNRKIQLNNKVVNGDGLPSEEVLYLAVSSDSSATINAMNVTLNILGFNTSSIIRNLNLVDDDDKTGIATEAQQILQLDQETVTATNTSSIDSKLVRGDDENIASALEVSLYARHPTGPDLGLLHMTNGHNLKVSIEEQNGTADLATETTLSLLNNKITVGEDDTLTQAQQILIYGRKDASPTGLSAVKVSSDGSLHVSTARNAFIQSNEVLVLPSNGTANSTAVNTLSQDSVGISASSTNSTDPIELYSSNDNLTFYPTNITGGSGTFYHEIYHPSFQYYRISQTDTTTTAGSINVICSKR